MLARHFKFQSTTVSTQSDILLMTPQSLLLFKPPRLSRRKTASQEELIVLETDRLLREQIEDGSELFLTLSHT
jgi:hypothetical protein